MFGEETKALERGIVGDTCHEWEKTDWDVLTREREERSIQREKEGDKQKQKQKPFENFGENIISYLLF